MRNALFALLLGSAGLLGLAATPSTAQADNTRIYVNLGDVSFDYGRPYYRHDRAPLFVSYDRWGHKRYYRHAPRHAYRSGNRDRHYDRVPVRPRVVYRDVNRGYYDNHHYRDGYRGRYWVDRYGRRHYDRY